MAYSTLELNIISATDLKDVNHLSPMEVYAVVLLAGDSDQEKEVKTPVDTDGRTNPTWNCPMTFRVNKYLARQNRLTLEIRLRTERFLGSDRDVGQVVVLVKELLDQPGDGISSQSVNYPVMLPSGKPEGSLKLSYKLGDELGIACPAPGVESSTGQHPPPPQHPAADGSSSRRADHGQPPPPGEGNPPVQNPQKKKKEHKFRKGLGAGLRIVGEAVVGAAVTRAVDSGAAYAADL